MRLARVRAGGPLQLGLSGLADNLLVITKDRWQCWNRKLDDLLISWQGFRHSERTALHEPVGCTITEHHAYSRTVFYRVYDGVITRLTLDATHRCADPPAQVVKFRRVIPNLESPDGS